MKLTSYSALLCVTAVLPTCTYSSNFQARTCSNVRYPPPSVRPPPQNGYHGRNFAVWVPPPSKQLYGIFHLTHVSYDQQNIHFVNLRVERYPLYADTEEYPVGSQAEISSWSTCADPTAEECKDTRAVSTIFGYNVPLGAQGPTDKTYTAAWQYNATGMLQGKVGRAFAIVAWGVDLDGFDYFVQYETGSRTDVSIGEIQTGGFSIASRNQDGINHSTYACLSNSLKQLAEAMEDVELLAVVSQIEPIRVDDRRHGEGPIGCDASCVRNGNLDASEHRHVRCRSISLPQMRSTSIVNNERTHLFRAQGGVHLPWWGWLVIGLVFGIPLLGALCLAVPIALLKGHRRRKSA